MSTTDHHFGACPQCGNNDGFYNAGRSHWFVCHEHRTRWWVGSNLFSGWKEETEEEQRHACEVEPGWGSYEDVDPPDPIILSEPRGGDPYSLGGVDEGPF
jgi:hypothetical protein